MKIKKTILANDSFELKPETDGYLETIALAGFKIREVDIGDITFRGGQQEPVHRWFRLTPSYSPNLVRFFLKELKVKKSDFVFDPFSGRGTTVIECQRNSINATALELNPLFRLIGKYSLDLTVGDLTLFDQYLNQLSKLIDKNKAKSLESIIKSYKVQIPDIHDVFRWWKEPVLKDLLIAKHLHESLEFLEIKNYLWIALNMASLECANIHRNHPTISFDDDHSRDINVYIDVHERIKKIQEDLSILKHENYEGVDCDINLGDSVNLASSLKDSGLKAKPSVVITSPPYPNRFSYIHQTRPQLHFMEVILDRKEATELDLKAIGGTWGRATSILMKELMVPSKEFESILTYFGELSEKSVLMCNYATKYFLDLDKHLSDLKKVMKKECRGAYVVGNSRLSGVEIHTEIILAKLFEKNGFRVPEILVFRKRGGKKKLYETAVCFTN